MNVCMALWPVVMDELCEKNRHRSCVFPAVSPVQVEQDDDPSDDVQALTESALELMKTCYDQSGRVIRAASGDSGICDR